MDLIKVLYVASAADPFLSMPPLSNHVKDVTEAMNRDATYQIRLFLPRFGAINERTNSIHEMIRLSGIDIPYTTHEGNNLSAVAKVSSVRRFKPPAYFVDNERIFEERDVFTDAQGKFLEGNDVRMLFFCKSVLEMISKLPWIPDIVHCHGWMTAMFPFYLKKAFMAGRPMSQTKSVYTLYNDAFDGHFSPNFCKLTRYKQLKESDVEAALATKSRIGFNALSKLAIASADRVTRTFSEVENQAHWQGINYQNIRHIPAEESSLSLYQELYSELHAQQPPTKKA